MQGCSIEWNFGEERGNKKVFMWKRQFSVEFQSLSTVKRTSL